MKKYLLGFLLAVASFSTFSQVATDTKSDSEAVNSGVNLSGGATSQHSYNIGLPSIAPGGVGIDKCLTSGIEQRSGLWNGVYDTTVVQKWSRECAFPSLVEVFLRSCQFYSARVLMDKHLKITYDIDPVVVYGSQELYAADLAKDKNLSLAECVKARAPVAAPAPAPAASAVQQLPPIVFEAPAAKPAPAPTPTVLPPVVVEKTVRETVTSLNTMALFATGKWNLLPGSVEALWKALSPFSPSTVTRITVEGRTDDVGPDAANMVLSKNRAEAVAAQIKLMGFTNVEVMALGETAPLVKGTDPQARAQNRSVWIVVHEVKVSPQTVAVK